MFILLLVIRRTISELPSVQIEGFIEQLVARFNECVTFLWYQKSPPCTQFFVFYFRTPLRMRTLGPWLRELLRQHISSSASIPSIQKNLFKIYYHASARLRYHHTAVKCVKHSLIGFVSYWQCSQASRRIGRLNIFGLPPY